jgi:tRNA(Leu) C34 or U34 (ribose-2'-O)-methylase TrmL
MIPITVSAVTTSPGLTKASAPGRGACQNVPRSGAGTSDPPPEATTFAATGTASLSYRDLDWTVPTLLLLGNEGRGIAPDLLASCQHPVRIPIHPPVESLNVAAAAAILLFEAAHQRTLKTPS